VNDAEILKGLTEICRENFGDDSLVLSPEMTADDVEGWDSFNHINVLVAAEMRFGIKFQTAEVEGLRDVGQLVKLIAKKTQAAAQR
jgi:acyl carrier protein